MTDELLHLPTGYIRHEPSIAEARQFVPMSAGNKAIAGKAKASGRNYFNIMDLVAGYLKGLSEGELAAFAGGRPTIDLGADGVVLMPLGQLSGVCNGCSHSEAATNAWIAHYAMLGTGPKPERCSFAWAYLISRDSQYVGRGDSGGIPSLTVRGYHDVGPLPISQFKELAALPPHGNDSEEAICIAYRDNPKEWLNRVRSYAEPYPTSVYQPSGGEDIADCIQTLHPVTFGASVQCSEPPVGGNGISSLYNLGGGHETESEGWLRLNGRLGFIKKESWWNVLFPASQWPHHRITVMTDDGPRTLYPGQAVVWADEWLRFGPESWAIGNPGGRP